MINGEKQKPDHALLWQCRSDPPQRYTHFYEKYLRLGGRARPPEFLQRVLAADPGNRIDMSRFYFFCLAFDAITKEQLDGDIAELGVYKGGTAALLAAFARELKRTAYLLDTFEGFDKLDLSGIDAGVADAFEDTSLEAVRAVVGDDNVRFVKGRFPDSASDVPPDAKFCLVHLDCDLYAPMRDALAFFYPRLTPGGFMIVHDYSSLAWGGPERAVDEFLVDKSESVIPLPDSAGSIVFRKARSPAHDAHWIWRKGIALPQNQWIDAGANALAPFLQQGWSGPEDWGVWGVGEAHSMRLFAPAPVARDFQFVAHCSAVLAGDRSFQEVDVRLAGNPVATWRFEGDENLAERSILLPAASAISLSSSVAAFDLEFRPRFTQSPMELDPANADDRPLGLALSRIKFSPLK